jgi:hypothetical protein
MVWHPKRGTPRVNLEALLFNVFINDIFYFVKKGTLYNYADDNTLSYGHESVELCIQIFMFLSKVFFPTASTWNLSGLACILFTLNQLIRTFDSDSIFHTFLFSNFNFCPLAWNFCTVKNSKKLEKVQERALRFVYDDYTSSYINLLEKALVPSLQIRRI